MSLVQTTIHVLLLLTPEVDPLSDIRFSEVNLWGASCRETFVLEGWNNKQFHFCLNFFPASFQLTIYRLI